ncbi:MAG: 4Fe-4S binding protein [Anaerolineae bacterium]|nr:4Fe-4S binding protein [Anaerolineae bacterium]
MTLGTMFRDIFHSLLRPPVTQRYPLERQDEPKRLRGQLIWNPDGCIGCGLCSKECPADAIEVITLDKKAKRFVVEYHLDRCTFCAQCVESCRFNCLELNAGRWELAGLQRDGFIYLFGEPTDIDEAKQLQVQESVNVE